MAQQIIGPDYQGGGAPRKGIEEAPQQHPIETYIPSGDATTGGDARPTPLTDALSKATEGLGNTVQEIADQQAKAQQDSWMLKNSSDYELQARQIMEQAQRSPDAANGIEGTVKAQLQQLQAQHMQGIDSPTLQETALAHFTRADEEVLNQSKSFDFEQRDKQTMFNLKQGAQNFGSVLLNSKYDDIDSHTWDYLGQYQDTLRNAGLKPDQYNQAMVEGKKIILDSANQGKIMQDPTRFEKENIASGAGDSAFSHADAFTAHAEGGFNPHDGNSVSNFGINQNAHPDIDVTKLSADQAQAIRKTEYWDKLGADKMPPAMAMAAYDTAIQSGVATAKDLVSQSGGDPQKLLALRVDFMQNWAKGDSPEQPHDQRMQALPAALQRIEQLGDYVKGAGNAPATGEDYTPKGNLSYRIATPEQQWEYKNQAFQMIRQEKSASYIADQGATTQMNEINKALANGDDVPKPARDMLASSLQGVSPKVEQQGQQTQRWLNISDNVFKMTPQDGAQYASQLRSQAKTPDQIADADYADKMVSAQARRLRESPVDAMARMGTPATPLDLTTDATGKLSKPETFQSRIALADNAVKLGADPKNSYLSANERSYLSNALSTSDVTTRLATAASMGQGFGDRAAEALSPLDKTQPLFTFAADTLGHNPNATPVMADMFRGEDMLKKNKDDAPSAANVTASLNKWSGYLPPAYLNTLANPLRAVGMARAYGSPDMSTKLDESLNDLVGAQQASVYGKNVAPIGVDGHKFEDYMVTLPESKIKETGATFGDKPMTKDDLSNGVTMVTQRPGMYQFRGADGKLVAGKGPNGVATLYVNPVDIQ